MKCIQVKESSHIFCLRFGGGREYICDNILAVVSSGLVQMLANQE